MAYAMRTVPPGFHMLALQEFDQVMRQALEGLLGEQLPDYAWAQAQLSIAHGGLGIRSAVQHSSAAYLASVLAAVPHCAQTDCEFDMQDVAGHLRLDATQAALREALPAGLAVDLDTAPPSQKHLSSLLDAHL
eukprot:1326846-Amphidinium_carterae.1